jgi:hypothetical protein
MKHYFNVIMLKVDAIKMIISILSHIFSKTLHAHECICVHTPMIVYN